MMAHFKKTPCILYSTHILKNICWTPICSHDPFNNVGFTLANTPNYVNANEEHKKDGIKAAIHVCQIS